jgi:hypothetical protein
MGPIATLLQKPGMPNPALVTLPAVQTQEPEPEPATPVIEIDMPEEITEAIPEPVRNSLHLHRKRKPTGDLPLALSQSTWERNHNLIIKALDELLKQHLGFPTVTAISRLTGITRNTIAAHLATCRQDERYKVKINSEKLMAEHLMADLLARALQGDLKAAKIFLDRTY